jgi:K+-sensing histidine kinase KdpD
MIAPRYEPAAPRMLGRQGLHAATLSDYLVACALVGASSLLCEQVRPYLSTINMVMAYLLAVVRLWLKPAILAAFLGVLAFDFYFVPPRFSLRTSDTVYLITFLALFIVGVVISSLVTRGRERAEALRLREFQTASQSCPGTTYAKLTWLQTWHIRDETYTAGLAELVNAQLPGVQRRFCSEGQTSTWELHVLTI